MARGGTIFAGVAVLVAAGGCHLIFGHDPGSASAAGDGRPRIDRVSGERRSGEVGIGEAGLVDGVAPREGVLAKDSVVLPPDKGPPPCDPTAGWCPQTSGTTKDLRDVWATDDASLAYAVGDGVALTRSSSAAVVWQPVSAVPAASWRGVHMVSKEAWFVGNESGTAVVYHLVNAASATPLSTVSISTQILNAIWMASPSAGFTAAATLGGGGATNKISAWGISSDDTTGSPSTSVTSQGGRTWVATSNLEIKYQDQAGATWGFQNLTGFAVGTSFTGVVALTGSGDGYMCGCGHRTSSAGILFGVVFCCKAQGSCKLYEFPGAELFAIAVVASSSGVTYWAVGKVGAVGGILKGTASLSPFGISKPQLGEIPPEVIRAIWASSTSTTQRLIAVGDNGTILQRQY